MLPGLPKITKLVCGSSGTGTQFFSFPACVLTRHSAAFVLTCSFNFSLNLIFPLPIPNQIFASNSIVRQLATELFSKWIHFPKSLGKQCVLCSFTKRKMCSFRGSLTFLLRGNHVMKGSFIMSLYKRQR